MKATIKQDNIIKDALKISHRKEKHYTGGLIAVAVKDSQLQEVIDLREYVTESRVYVCIWIHDRASQTYIASSGCAGGYGYHKPSAAAGDALHRCGITLSEDIHGRGDEATVSALKAIMHALGHENVYIIKAHA